MKLKGPVFGLGLIALSACGGDGDGSGGSSPSLSGPRWACNMAASNNACIEYTGSEWNSIRKPNYERVCLTSPRTPGTIMAACPAAWLGRCLTFEGTATEQYNTFYAGADISDARRSCESTGRGRWIAP